MKGDRLQVRITDKRFTGWKYHYGNIYDVEDNGRNQYRVLVTENNTKQMEVVAKESFDQQDYISSFYKAGQCLIGSKYAEIYRATNIGNLGLMKQDELL